MALVSKLGLVAMPSHVAGGSNDMKVIWIGTFLKTK
jgi:hypothetical protein